MVNKTLAIARAVMADAVRRKIVWVVIVFAALLAMAIKSLPSYGLGVVDEVFREVSIALMWVGALVVGLALSVTRIPQEVERRTVYNVIARDVARWEYIAGTWLGMFAVVGMVVLAFGVTTIGVGWVQYHALMWRLFEAAFAVWLEMGIVMAFAVLMSAMFGPVTATVASLAFVFIGHSVVQLMNVSELDRVPWYMPTLDTFNVINPVAHGSGYGLTYALAMTLMFSAWIGVLLFGASALFGTRDL